MALHGRTLRVVLAFLVAAALGWRWWATSSPEGGEWILRFTPVELVANVVLTWLGLLVASALLGGRARGARYVLRCALVTGSLGMVWVGVEIPVVLGHDYAETFGVTSHHSAWEHLLRTNRFDAELIHRHRAGASWQGRVAGNLRGLGIPATRTYPVDVRYDEHGFRNPRHPETASVVVIGDSFVEAPLIAWEQTLPARLEQALARPVANLGQVAYGPQQERIVLERYGLPLEPEVVVWVLYEDNDLIDARNFEAWQDAGRPVIRATETPWWRRTALVNAGIAAERGMTRAERLAEGERWSGWFLQGGERVDRVWFKGAGAVEDDPGLPLAQREIRLAARRCAERDIRFLVLFAPGKYRVYAPFCAFEASAHPRAWVAGELPARLAAWCRAEGIAFLDATPALQERLRSGVHVYFPDDEHWNAEAYAVVCDLVLPACRD